MRGNGKHGKLKQSEMSSVHFELQRIRELGAEAVAK